MTTPAPVALGEVLAVGSPLVRAYTFSSSDGAHLVTSLPLLLTGVLIRETSGAATAGLELRDGSGAGGKVIVSASALSGATFQFGLPWPGLAVRAGLYVSGPVGTYTATVYAAIMEV